MALKNGELLAKLKAVEITVRASPNTRRKESESGLEPESEINQALS